MSTSVEGLSAVTIHIRDIAKAGAFYRDALGLKETAFDAAAARAAYAIPGSPTFLTMHVMGPNEAGREPGTVSGVVFYHSDPRVLLEHVRAHGGSVTMEPVEVEVDGRKFVRSAFADPDGNEFLLSNRKY